MREFISDFQFFDKTQWSLLDRTEERMTLMEKAYKFNSENHRQKNCKQTLLMCPYCGKQGGKSGMKRHHFENCPENWLKRRRKQQ